ncbi:MAG: helix-turn-helix domain-containing protein [Paeniglutamicibacter terrestris]|uniref:Helix-turn-helix transcriptional regulator n=1 Tax=Paeniglutamicibacter terrestris TaxID=2723403 RepID=A0ABX1G032_9MICC|nr:TetR/AcrR family transcriptional regulator [Paeniglutamicibacter terrestris]ASN38212.1 TetR family transcriptional regulator [Arthrobacter sp. 7749]NKG19581.1 helix-turn-helix transcriptional regulator [Paeniglutamicibacter terrestris]
MARVQEFDTSKALSDARGTFWEKGFDATSIADLEAATGLGRSSIYHGFGSKRGLFDAVIQDYMDRVLRPRLGLLSDPAHRADATSWYLSSLSSAVAQAAAQSKNRGCLLLNTAAGLGGSDEPLRILIDGYQLELRDGVAGALRVANPLLTESQALARARIIAGLTVSALMMSRVNVAEALATLDSAAEQVQLWQQTDDVAR